tara:strand:+ start:695 stop:913 length:219 start_codon:yes stop_codon:yes gene_type:complete
MNFRGGKRTKKKRSKSLRKASGPFRNRRKTKSRPSFLTASLMERLSKHKYLSMRNSMRTSMRSRNKTRGRKY